MKEVFIGLPTKEEINLYLRQREYSLMNMKSLRDDIISKKFEQKCDLLYKNFFLDTLKNSKEPFLKDKTNNPIKFFYKSNVSKSKIEKKSSKHMKQKKSSSRFMRKMTMKNTQRNSGYKYIELQYKSKRVHFNGKNNFNKSKNITKRPKSGSIKWSVEYKHIPHNPNEVRSVLKSSMKVFKKVDIKKKIKIPVEAKVFVPALEFNMEFNYTINK